MRYWVAGQRIRARSCWCEHRPSLDEILDDPLIRAVMDADGVDREELAAILLSTSAKRRAAVHPSITPERVYEAVERAHFSIGYHGICIACGAEVERIAPDAERGRCESCGARAAFGADLLLLLVDQHDP